MERWQINALASVLKMPINLICPRRGNPIVRDHLHRLILPICLEGYEIAHIMWCSTQEDMRLGHWQPNHFVPVISVDGQACLLDETFPYVSTSRIDGQESGIKESKPTQEPVSLKEMEELSARTHTVEEEDTAVTDALKHKINEKKTFDKAENTEEIEELNKNPQATETNEDTGEPIIDGEAGLLYETFPYVSTSRNDGQESGIKESQPTQYPVSSKEMEELSAEPHTVEEEVNTEVTDAIKHKISERKPFKEAENIEEIGELNKNPQATETKEDTGEPKIDGDTCLLDKTFPYVSKSRNDGQESGIKESQPTQPFLC